MRPHEAEKLLGGYAAGILTEAEKTALFTAALEHQELFDALANEEALRELLADPATRQHLLILLEEPRARRPVPFWRRPATLGLAASLLLTVTTSLVLWQREHPVLPAPEPSVAKSDSATPVPIPVKPAAAASPAPSRGGDMRGASEVPPPKVAERMADSPAHLMAKAAPMPEAEAKKQPAETPKSEAVVEVLAAAMAPDKAEARASTSFSKERLEELPTRDSLAARADLAPGVAAGKAASVARAKGPSIPVPTWTLEPIELGRFRLTVTWATGNHLYAIKRTPGSLESLPVRDSVPDPRGTTRSHFEFTVNPEDHLDLYLLHRPEAHPESLPATGAVDGYRKRVR